MADAHVTRIRAEIKHLTTYARLPLARGSAHTRRVQDAGITSIIVF